jgi:hypothetical protein
MVVTRESLIQPGCGRARVVSAAFAQARVACCTDMDPEIPLIQARLSHEDDLINQRISWLVNSQSFL